MERSDHDKRFRWKLFLHCSVRSSRDSSMGAFYR
jgi:hypothetical protein